MRALVTYPMLLKPTNLTLKGNWRGTIACSETIVRVTIQPEKLLHGRLSRVILNCVNTSYGAARMADNLKYSIEINLTILEIRRIFPIRIRLDTIIVKNYNEITNGDSKTIKQRVKGTAGRPKTGNGYGLGRFMVAVPKRDTCRVMPTEICEGRRYYSSGRKDLETGMERLLQLRNNISEGKAIKGIYKILLKEEIYKIAYDELRENQGSYTAGIDGKLIRTITKTEIDKLIQELKDHTYKAKPCKRVEIDKKIGKKRKLGIPTTRDRLVQKSMSLILESIYEPIFSNRSFGFRREKGTHNCLKYIKSWAGIKWFVNIDIKEYFDTIDHKKLYEIMEEKILDAEWRDLYWKTVKAGYVEKGIKKSNTEGVPQGSTLSPILSNIYLHGLDKMMEELETEAKKSGEVTVENPEYKKWHTLYSNLQQKHRKGSNWTNEDKEKVKEARLKRSKLKSKIQGKGYRLYYARYADDFMIGVAGSRKVAETIKEKVTNYLQEKRGLKLNIEKSNLTEATKGVEFLGTVIKRPGGRTNERTVGKRIYNGVKRRARMSDTRLRLLIPKKKLTKKLEDQGMCKIKNYEMGKIKPTAKTAWMNLSEIEIVQRFNSVNRGIINYYSFAHNKSQLNLIQFILLHSCAKTLGRKLRLRRRSQVFKRLGGDLRVSKTVKFEKLNLKRTDKFQKTGILDLEGLFTKLRSRKIEYKEHCDLCGTITERLEIHHIKPIKKNKSVKSWANSRNALNRRHIVVCRKCHEKIHGGKYDSLKL